MAPRSSPRGVVHGTVDANAEGVAWPTLSSRLSRWADPPAAEDPGPSLRMKLSDLRRARPGGGQAAPAGPPNQAAEAAPANVVGASTSTQERNVAEGEIRRLGWVPSSVEEPEPTALLEAVSTEDGGEPWEPRLLLGAAAGDGPARSLRLRDHLRIHGAPPTGDFAGGGEPAGRLVAILQDAGLRGRGGSGFPFALKLRSVLSEPGTPIVVANGSESDPQSAKDHALLTLVPHLVLDGAELVASAIGANAVVVVAKADTARNVAQAVTEREQVGLDSVPITVVVHEGDYVGGEASALCNWLTNGHAIPRQKPPHMSERGVAGRPTLLSNVETLAHVALIARRGAAWFRRHGTPEDPGTTLVTLTGAVGVPGVYEVPRSARLSEVIALAGSLSAPVGAFLVGGFGGTWVSARRAFDARLSDDGLRPLGATLGCGAIMALDARRCGLAISAEIVGYLADQGAGQCGPCVNVVPALAQELARLASPGAMLGGSPIARWAEELRGRGACGLPTGVGELVLSALRTFRQELEAHAIGRCVEVDARRDHGVRSA
jgi:NADH:ubiquinone oxidoreductase subunit F (NADH-binding)